MPRFLSPIYVKQEIVTGNETISGNETILGVTSGKTSYWTTVNSELSVSSNLGWFNSLSTVTLSTNNLNSYSISANDLKSISAIGEIALYQTITGVTIKADKFYGDGSGITGILASGGYSTDIYKLPLSGGTLTGGITGTEAIFNIISSAVISGTYYGDGSKLTGINNGSTVDSTKLPLTGGTINGDLTVTGTFSTQNTEKWNNTYNTVSTNSAKWDSVYSNVNSNSASWTETVNLSTNVLALQNLTAGFTNTSNTVNTNSAKWENSYSTVNTNSASWTTTVNISTNVLALQNLTAGFTNTSNTVSTNSAKWESVYSNVNSNSATYVTLTGTQTLTNKTVIDWMTLVRGYNTTPILLATIPNGEVYSYVYTSSPSNITYYRFISTDGSTDIFYTYFSGTTLSGVVASKSITL